MPPDTAQIVDTAVREAMQRYTLPGIAVGLIEDGEVRFARGYGEILAGSGQPVTTTSVFKIASNTKAMTAALLARLVDAGKLRWDDPVIQHLPAFRMHDPWVTREIQVRDLLIHNSGLGLGAGDLMLWPEPNQFSREDVMAGLAHLKPASSFRSTYAYDNLLYIIAGEVAAAAGGADYETLMAREVFAPLGLQRCRVGAFERDALGNVAQPHRAGKVPGNVDDQYIQAITSAAAGGVRCSLDDMLTWMRNWLDPQLTPEWLSASQRQAMWRAHMPMPVSTRATRWENTHFTAYGYGFRLSDVNGFLRVAHTGTLGGMYSAMALFPERRSGYVFLINGEASQARIALEAVLSRHITRPGSAPALAEFAYELDDASAVASVPAAMDAAVRVRVVAEELRGQWGIYRDPWFGDVSFCPVGEAVRWVSRKSPRMHGTVQRVGERFLVAWDDPGVAGADAWLDLSPSRDGSPTMTLVAVDPAIDFSYDFHDLSLQRMRPCD
ncbi:serine hydrolase [Xanthomonadaceae bacterium JHOS43]|nr:serine hydrolase [Xanthomonadaceae bacterium JHOS43]